MGVDTEGTGLSEDLADGEGLAGGAGPLLTWSAGSTNVSILCLTGSATLGLLCVGEARLGVASVGLEGAAGAGSMEFIDASVHCLSCLAALASLGVGEARLCKTAAAPAEAAGAGSLGLADGAALCVVGSGVFALLAVGVVWLDVDVVELVVADSASGLADSSRGGVVGFVVNCLKRRMPITRTRDFSDLVRLWNTPFAFLGRAGHWGKSTACGPRQLAHCCAAAQVSRAWPVLPQFLQRAWRPQL